jgi:hypothetical protein
MAECPHVSYAICIGQVDLEQLKRIGRRAGFIKLKQQQFFAQHNNKQQQVGTNTQRQKFVQQQMKLSSGTTAVTDLSKPE